MPVVRYGYLHTVFQERKPELVTEVLDRLILETKKGKYEMILKSLAEKEENTLKKKCGYVGIMQEPT